MLQHREPRSQTSPPAPHQAGNRRHRGPSTIVCRVPPRGTETITSHSNEECSHHARDQAQGLVKTYPGPGKTRIRALDGLTLSVPRGTIFAVVGPNGAGKTTTVKILTTLATPDEGTATVEGIDVRTVTGPGPPGHRGGRAALGRRPGATGRENLVLQGHLYGMPAGAAKARADELLERFRLTDAAGRFVRTYSGGMQRRLDVALGLMHRPAVLFLDEPTPASTRNRVPRCGRRSPHWPRWTR